MIFAQVGNIFVDLNQCGTCCWILGTIAKNWVLVILIPFPVYTFIKVPLPLFDSFIYLTKYDYTFHRGDVITMWLLFDRRELSKRKWQDFDRRLQFWSRNRENIEAHIEELIPKKYDGNSVLPKWDGDATLHRSATAR